MEKSQILDQNDGLTPLQKCQFFDFLNFLFLLPRKAFLRSRIEKNTFLWPILPKKQLEKWPLFDQNHKSTAFQKCLFFDF